VKSKGLFPPRLAKPRRNGAPDKNAVLTKNSVEHVIYEKNPDIGGTWLENRYPGAACDVPSHAYTYNFALK
jgi:hypothetical protein